MKEKIVSILQTIGLVLWGLSILVGTIIGYDGSLFLGLLIGFAVGAAFATLFYMLGNLINKPYLLLSFLTIPIGYLIGILWGNVGSVVGIFIGGFMTFTLLLKFHDKEF